MGERTDASVIGREAGRGTERVTVSTRGAVEAAGVAVLRRPAEVMLAALVRNRSSCAGIAPARTGEAVRSDDWLEARAGCGSRPLRELAFPSCALGAPGIAGRVAAGLDDTNSSREDFAPSRPARDVSFPATDSSREEFAPARPARDASFPDTDSSRADFAPLPVRDPSFDELASSRADFGASFPAREVAAAARAFTSASSAPVPGAPARPFTSRVSAATADGWAAAGRGRFRVSSAPASFASEPSFTAVDFDDARAMARPL
jgi:hypothetical protein